MVEQFELFSNDDPDLPRRLGQAEVEYQAASAILTPASGFVESYDYTLNPYSGCAFGCTYCYAAFFSREPQLQENWGYWVRVKRNATELLRKKRASSIAGKSIYMSSVTDPYQPVERKLGLTRSLLKELVPHQPRLVVQTRSPLATRDLDLFRQFDAIQINMTVTTDDEEVRKGFEPLCPSNRRRLDTIQEITAAGVPTCITLTPLLPVRDPEKFAEQLIETGVERFVVQQFHASQESRFVAGTQKRALAISEKLGWSEHRYREIVRILKNRLPHLAEGKEGFTSI